MLGRVCLLGQILKLRSLKRRHPLWQTFNATLKIRKLKGPQTRYLLKLLRTSGLGVTRILTINDAPTSVGGVQKNREKNAGHTPNRRCERIA